MNRGDNVPPKRPASVFEGKCTEPGAPRYRENEIAKSGRKDWPNPEPSPCPFLQRHPLRRRGSDMSLIDSESGPPNDTPRREAGCLILPGLNTRTAKSAERLAENSLKEIPSRPGCFWSTWAWIPVRP